MESENKNSKTTDTKPSLVDPNTETLAHAVKAKLLPNLSQYQWYMSGQGLFFFAGGIQFVLVQWLITFYLREPPEVVGIAMMIIQLPQLIFALIGGLFADRKELRQHLIRLQMFTLLPPIALSLVILADQTTTWIIVFISFFGGSVMTLIQPARDALLTKVARHDDVPIQRAVTFANGLQFGMQMLGISLVARADLIGPIPLLATQLVIFSCAIYTTFQLSPTQPHPRPRSEKKLSLVSEFREGFEIAFGSAVLRPVIAWSSIMSLVNMGVFLVTLPLIVREVYDGDSLALSMMLACFFGGVTISSMMLSRFPQFPFPGRVMLVSAIGAISAMYLIHFELPIFLFFGMILVWGITGGVSMSMSRSLLQQAAPDSHRARILSISMLTQFGMSPVAAFAAGYLVRAFGPLDAIAVSATAGVCVWLGFLGFSNLRHINARKLGYR